MLLTSGRGCQQCQIAMWLLLQHGMMHLAYKLQNAML
jgi:hypothetical protein